MLNKEMGERILSIRQKLKMDQWSFAKQLNMHPKSIIDWESGNYAPTVDEINNLAKTFSIPNSYILNGKPDNIIPINKEDIVSVPIMNNDLNLKKIEGYIETNRLEVPSGLVFYVKCIDDLMKPIVKKGAYLLVHSIDVDKVNDGDIVLISVNDGPAKPYYINKSDDEEYKDFNFYFNEENKYVPVGIFPDEHIKFIGKVILNVDYL